MDKEQEIGGEAAPKQDNGESAQRMAVPSTSLLTAGNTEVATPASDDPSQSDTAKYRSADGTWNGEAILADLRKTEERLEGLRKKLAGVPRLAHRGKAPTLGTASLPSGPDDEIPDVANPASEAPSPAEAVKMEDLEDELKTIGDGEDRAFAEKFIGLLGKSGLSKEKAGELLGGLAEIQRPEDPKVFFAKEMEKLGPDGKEIVGRVRMFRDAMRDSKEFGDGEIAELERVTQTADGVQLIAKVLDRARTLDNGKFSNYRPSGAGGEELSHSDRIAMYEKAYALNRTNPSESKAEIARLDRMFTK